MIDLRQDTEFAYLDETGDPEIDITKSGVSKFYVVCAVLVNGDDNATARCRADAVRQKHFGSGEMKSSHVGSNISRRRKILEDIGGVGITFCAFVADKAQINRDSGLQYRRSFVKYFYGRLYERLYRAFSNLHVVAHQLGGSDFMQGFERYIAKGYQQQIFDHADFRFAAGSDEPLIGVADMIVGTLGRVYSGKDPIELRSFLDPFAIIVERWPPSSVAPDIIEGLDEAQKFDHLVAQQSIMQAQIFLHQTPASDDPDERAQVDTVRYLLYKYEIAPSWYVCTAEILDHLNGTREDLLSEHMFRSRVIAQLRSSRVIIASSRTGYKIPNCAKDMDSFVDLVNCQAIPFLERLALAQNHLIVASKGKYDIVPPERYPKLADCLRVLNQGGQNLHTEADKNTNT